MRADNSPTSLLALSFQFSQEFFVRKSRQISSFSFLPVFSLTPTTSLTPVTHYSVSIVSLPVALSIPLYSLSLSFLYRNRRPVVIIILFLLLYMSAVLPDSTVTQLPKRLLVPSLSQDVKVPNTFSFDSLFSLTHTYQREIHVTSGRRRRKITPRDD